MAVTNMRLRAKLVATVIGAALLPIVVLTIVAAQVVFANLERALQAEATRQLQVATNLFLRGIEHLGADAAALAERPDLPLALRGGATELAVFARREAQHLGAAMLQLFDTESRELYRFAIGGNYTRLLKVAVGADAARLATARQRGRDVYVDVQGEQAFVRALAPIMDATAAVRGVVVLSVPIDGDYVDGLKGALGVDVWFATAQQRAIGTFRDRDGTRLAPFTLPVDLASALQKRTQGFAMFANASVLLAGAPLAKSTAPVDAAIGIAVERAALVRTKRLALRALVVGSGVALAAAWFLALWWSRRLTAPLAELHRGALAVSRGDLDYRIAVRGDDELGALANAFTHMTKSLKDNQGRLAARMREIVALHDAGRAVSAVLDPAPLTKKVVESVARVFDVAVVGLWVVGDHTHPDSRDLRLTAARARRADISTALAADEALETAAAMAPVAVTAYGNGVLRMPADAARQPAGPIAAVPLERGGRKIGVIVVARGVAARDFSDADLHLLVTFADQASAAIDNALLYREVQNASVELERKVAVRTTELTAMNSELGRTLADLRETQAQLILSERLAGLGMLVAGVAHEINSPSAAISGSIAALENATTRTAEQLLTLGAGGLTEAARTDLAHYLRTWAPKLAHRRMLTGVAARVAAKEVRSAVLQALTEVAPAAAAHEAPQWAGLANEIARALADAGLVVDDVAAFAQAVGKPLSPTVGRSATLHPWQCAASALLELVYLHRTAATIGDAIRRIVRIVGALKSYSHLDQQEARVATEIHAGLETTLALFDYQLRDIAVERRFVDLPRVPVYVDELNQVWTNLVQNATHAILRRAAQRGPAPASQPLGHIVIATALVEAHVVVTISDDGTGIAPEVLPKIFEPFFTTKAKGEGTGLGLGICQQIIEKHQGRIVCQSRVATATEPGHTEFAVWLPIAVARREEGDMQ